MMTKSKKKGGMPEKKGKSDSNLAAMIHIKYWYIQTRYRDPKRKRGNKCYLCLRVGTAKTADINNPEGLSSLPCIYNTR